MIFLVLYKEPGFFQALPFAVLAYGVTGGFLGLLYGAIGGLSTTLRRQPLDASALYTSCWSVLLALALTYIARGQLYRYLLSRSIALSGLRAVLFHAGSVILFLALFLLARFLWKRIVRVRALRWLASGWTGLATFVVLGLLASLGFLLTRPQPIQSNAAGKLPASPDHPNILLIVADAQRADRLSCYGYEQQISPNLDVLATKSVLYRNAFSQASWTKPSFATILSSLYPTSHTVTDGSRAFPDEVLTLAEVLSQQGYVTGAFANNANLAPTFNFGQGFSEYHFLTPSNLFNTPTEARWVSIYRLIAGWVYSPQGKGLYVDRYYQDAAVVNGKATSWIQAQREHPFFLMLHYMEPHAPYFEHPYNGHALSLSTFTHPSGELLPEANALYDAEIRYMDEHLGVLFEWLQQENLYDNTMIIFTADHGEEFYDHQGWSHGETLYEEVLHVPLIIKYPQEAAAGTTVTQLVRSMDIAPTILAVAGISQPEIWQGQSFWPTTQELSHVFAEDAHRGYLLRAARTSTQKLILANPENPRGLPPEECFDLTVDPNEQHNIGISSPNLVAKLKEHIFQTMTIAQAGAVEAKTGSTDEEVEEMLRNLGY